jgi:beta-glucanase (GH16 family)
VKTRYTSGTVSTWGRFSQAYGRFEARMKVPAATVKGLHEAFWLWPDYPAKYGSMSGEIDIAEIYSRLNDRAIPFIHYTSLSPDPDITNNHCMIDRVGDFHTYAAEWTPHEIKILYDGKICLVDVWRSLPLIKPAPFDRPFIVALTQALGQAGNALDPATNNAFVPGTTPLPATTEVDYVRVWR